MVAEAVEVAGTVLEIVGVAIIVLGALLALARSAQQLTDASTRVAAYQRSRQQIGRSVLLGLELLVASDIVRTVAVTPTFTSIGVLAVVVLVRTFLSFTLTMEIEGQWPWNRDGGSSPRD